MSGSPRKPDERFLQWGVQPRVNKLTRKLLAVARMDDAFAEAMLARTSRPERVRSWLAGETTYEGAACQKHGTTLRRVYDSSCAACAAERTSDRFGQRADGTVGRLPYRATRTKTSETDLAERRRTAAKVGVVSYQRGPWAATVHPNGRIELANSERRSHCPDFAKEFQARGAAWLQAAASDPDLTALCTVDLGWS